MVLWGNACTEELDDVFEDEVNDINEGLGDDEKITANDFSRYVGAVFSNKSKLETLEAAEKRGDELGEASSDGWYQSVFSLVLKLIRQALMKCGDTKRFFKRLRRRRHSSALLQMPRARAERASAARTPTRRRQRRC